MPYRSATGPRTSAEGIARFAGGVSSCACCPSSMAKCSNPAGEAKTSTRVGSTSTVKVCGIPRGAKAKHPAVDVQRRLGGLEGHRLYQGKAPLSDRGGGLGGEPAAQRPHRLALARPHQQWLALACLRHLAPLLPGNNPVWHGRLALPGRCGDPLVAWPR